MESYKGDCFCPSCGSALAHHTDEEESVNPTTGRVFMKKVHFLTCGLENCPLQFKRIPLPQTT